MASRLKKVGSLGLGMGALALVMANAAMTHGCAGSQSTQQASSAPATDPDCVAPSYMYATKAPVYWSPPAKCTGGKTTPMPQPPAQANAIEQAP